MGRAGYGVLSRLGHVGPYETSLQSAIQALSGHTHAFLQRRNDAAQIATVAQFAQYTLVITSMLWDARRRPNTLQARPDL